MRYVSRRTVVVSAVLIALAAAVGTFAVAQNLRFAPSPETIEVRALPITSFDNRDPARVRFGALEFRGGLELTSSFSAFGGISGLLMPDHDHLLAITDNGSWLKARLVYNDGRLVNLADAEMAPLLGADGKPLAGRRAYDAESIARLGDSVYVGIERVDRIVQFAYNSHGFAARGEDIRVPNDFNSFAKNASLECLTAPPPGQPHAGKLVVVTERSLDAAGNHRAFVLDPAAKDGDAGVLRFTVARSDDFDVTDCTILPPGDVLLLERRFSPLRGVAMRMRRVSLAAIKDGALVDGPVLIEADLGYQIDNMEGLAVTKNTAGETIVTIVSDDNFSPVQRNLILQFALIE
ncbi:esterase-like activity of phytase family protein [Undibacter mobilis]|uniref:Twin-arginine translocation pathway signal n=1 Tax=Undibacter mobilis TaxID=2292256 RepID=A0A371B8P2_9BRAD|nr:esterase-like activity of phytase family protein [Undibacter mobilis]RDV03793.1 twin-arginine translocation pathway signal [Undibacter mobilis]